jgi:hypothetical protein
LLLKYGTNLFKQEPFNEVLATAIMRRLEVPHVPYALAFEGDEPLSICEDFITPQTELISAWHLRAAAKKSGHLSEYQHYINCCEKLGISGAVDGINKMLTVDFLIMNEDSHMNNFGAVRNAETLEWQGLAPIFDSGTSLWYNTIHVGSVTRESKPFRNRHSEQIKLVTDFDWLDFDALRGIDEEFSEILKNSEYIDDRRRSVLCRALKTRVEMLQQIVQEQSPVHGIGIKMQ